MWEVQIKLSHISTIEAHNNICKILQSATHQISHCRKQIPSINDMSWQVFPLLILQADNHRSVTRLWLSLHKTWIQSISPHSPLHRTLSNTVLFNSDWQVDKHYKPNKFSSQKEHSCTNKAVNDAGKFD